MLGTHFILQHVLTNFKQVFELINMISIEEFNYIQKKFTSTSYKVFTKRDLGWLVLKKKKKHYIIIPDAKRKLWFSFFPEIFNLWLVFYKSEE